MSRFVNTRFHCIIICCGWGKRREWKRKRMKKNPPPSFCLFSVNPIVLTLTPVVRMRWKGSQARLQGDLFLPEDDKSLSRPVKGGSERELLSGGSKMGKANQEWDALQSRFVHYCCHTHKHTIINWQRGIYLTCMHNNRPNCDNKRTVAAIIMAIADAAWEEGCNPHFIIPRV